MLPRRIGTVWITLPSGWMGAAVAADSGSVSAGSGSYATAIASSAIWAVSGWSAATTATGSPS